MLILAIDPGTVQSGWCVYSDGLWDRDDVPVDDRPKGVKRSGVTDNEDVLRQLRYMLGWSIPDALAIEMVASYGMPVGREVFETVRWIGRFQQAWRDPEAVRLIYRKDVKIHLCGSMKATDSNIRRALIDKLGPVGTKKQPGPTYGIVGVDAWSAVAIAVTAAETT